MRFCKRNAWCKYNGFSVILYYTRSPRVSAQRNIIITCARVNRLLNHFSGRPVVREDVGEV